MSENGQQVGQQNLVTKAAFARMQGWDRSYLSKKDMVGRLREAAVLVKDDRGRERIDVDAATVFFSQNTDTAKVRKPVDSVAVAEVAEASNTPDAVSHASVASSADEGLPTVPANSLDHYRREQARAKLEEQELDLAERKAQTLSREEVYRAMGAAGHAIRTALKMRNYRVAQKLTTMTDAREIAVLLDESDREILQQVSDDLMRRLPMPGDGEPTTH